MSEHDAVARKVFGVTLRTMVARIERVFDRATDSDLEEGALWYPEAEALARDWSVRSGYAVENCAAAISHLSQRARWTRNVLAAEALIMRGERLEGVMRGAYARASVALVAEDPESTFGGPKTLRFYRNILGDREAVTVDVWAARVAGVDDALLTRKGAYAAVEYAYRLAARRRGVCPATMQATTWILARGGRAGLTWWRD